MGGIRGQRIFCVDRDYIQRFLEFLSFPPDVLSVCHCSEFELIENIQYYNDWSLLVFYASYSMFHFKITIKEKGKKGFSKKCKNNIFVVLLIK